jgi:pterin-4a-carbinolamine dehydratase
MGVYLHYPHVKVSSITRGINEATDLDIEYLQEIDCLYEDSK